MYGYIIKNIDNQNRLFYKHVKNVIEIIHTYFFTIYNTLFTW